MSARMAGRLSELRHLRFIGRAAERMLFQSALTEPVPPFNALYIFGPGGVGKSTLLREFDFSSKQANIPSVVIDARNVEPTPEAFMNVLRLMMGLAPEQSPYDAIADTHKTFVLLIDTYETLAPLDDWLREVFLPNLPENTLIVLAGRRAPSRGWRADPAWQTLIRTISLRNFRPQESKAFLTQREVPPERHEKILDFTYGHPLALSLVAEVIAQRPDAEFNLDEEPDVVKTLLEQFVEKVPGPAHRAALEVCSLVRLTSEALLADVFRDQPTYDANDLFEWLRGLSFIEKGPFGLFPHDLAREALVADLRWRNPNRYADLHHRVRNYIIGRFQQAHGIEQQTLLFDLTFLHRYNPVVRPFFEWQESGSMVPDMLRPEDMPHISDMIDYFEGSESAHYAGIVMDRHPETFLVFRGSEGNVEGFVSMIPLHLIEDDLREADPALRTAWQYLQQNAPLRSGEGSTHFRWWMARETYQQMSALQTLIFINVVRHYLTTPGLAYHFFPCADPDFWTPVLSYADLHRVVGADYVLEGRSYGVFSHDWRVVPPLTWLDLLGEREIESEAAAASPIRPASPAQIVVLSQPEFVDAVRDALRLYSIPDGLRDSPLLRSRLVAERAGIEATTDARMGALQSVIKEAAELLASSPREAKLYRSLYHTYFQPAPTQEQAAELLDLPFSTYRRHLKRGIERLTEILWTQEIGR